MRVREGPESVEPRPGLGVLTPVAFSLGCVLYLAVLGFVYARVVVSLEGFLGRPSSSWYIGYVASTLILACATPGWSGVLTPLWP